MSVVTYRNAIQNGVVDFLKKVTDSKFRLFLQDTIPTIVSQLLFYREEGRFLYPEVYIFKDRSVLKVLPEVQIHKISEEEVTDDTVRKAIKKCAPLCENKWSIYLLISDEVIEYGIFSGGEGLTSVHREDCLLDDITSVQLIVCIRVVRDKLISVRNKGNHLLVFFDITDEHEVEDIDVKQKQFIKQTLNQVQGVDLDPHVNFLRRLFTHVLRYGHGTLACVIDRTTEVNSLFEDGIILPDPIDFIPLLGPYSGIKPAIREGLYELLSGMLQSDGITVFTNDGKVLAYNVFIKLNENQKNQKPMGGARSRAFHSLKDNEKVLAAYMQSQDGNIHVHEK